MGGISYVACSLAESARASTRLMCFMSHVSAFDVMLFLHSKKLACQTRVLKSFCW